MLSAGNEDALSTGNEDALSTGNAGVGSVHTVVVVPDVKALKLKELMRRVHRSISTGDNLSLWVQLGCTLTVYVLPTVGIATTLSCCSP